MGTIQASTQLNKEEQCKISWQGLIMYFDAVSLQLHHGGCDTGAQNDVKLQRIANCFTEDAILITPAGDVLNGRDGVRSFYGSPASPVMQNPSFQPRPIMSSACFNNDGHTIAIEIDLPLDNTSYVRVGDWFSFTKEGLIARMSIFSRPPPAPVAPLQSSSSEGNVQWISNKKCLLPILMILWFVSRSRT